MDTKKYVKAFSWPTSDGDAAIAAEELFLRRDDISEYRIISDGEGWSHLYIKK